MIKVKDKITLGIIAGILSNIFVSIIDILCYKLNISQFIHIHIVASAYFPVSDIHTIPALIVGTISDFIIAAFFGVMIVYVLFFTGTDFLYVKGLFFVLVYWLMIYGLIRRLNIARIDPTDPGTNLVHLAIYILLGLLTSWLIAKHGIPMKSRN